MYTFLLFKSKKVHDQCVSFHVLHMCAIFQQPRGNNKSVTGIYF